MKANIIDYIKETIEEDATPEEYRALLDDTIPVEERGRTAYEEFMGRIDTLKELGDRIWNIKMPVT